MHQIGIVGASGYTGAELLRLLATHPELDVAWATGDTQAGNRVAAVYPSLAAAYPTLTFSRYDASAADGLDLVFCGLPHGESQQLMPELRKRVGPGVGALHPAPGSDDPRHPGHLLRASAPRDVDGGPARAVPRALRRGAVRGRVRGAALDQGDVGIEHRAPHGPL